MGQIYMIKNNVNLKVYIGQTIRNIDYRYGSNGITSVLNTTHNEHLKKSIAKYGVDNFELIILHEDIDEKNELNILEQKCIKKYNSTDPEKGYNKILTHESMGELTKKSIICINDGLIYDSLLAASEYYNVHISKISSVCNGNRKHTRNLVFKFYDEDKKYDIREYIPKKVGKKVICINDNKIFDSITDAGKYYEIGTDSISACCNGRNISTKTGLQFAFYDKGRKYSTHSIYTPPTRKVICIDTGQVFSSAKEVCKEMNIGIGNLSSVLQKRSKTAKGYRFEYLDEVHNINIDTVKTNKDYNLNQKKQVICINDGKIFDSISEAAIVLNIESRAISACCRKKSIQAKGLYFEYYDENEDYTDKIIKLNEVLEKSNELKIISNNSIKVICINTGEIYDSMAEAAFKVGGKSGNSIRCCCNGVCKTAYGYQWAYYEEGKKYELKQYEKYNGRKVICIDTKVIYRSVRHAATELELNEGSIRACCSGKYKTAGGLQWSYYQKGKVYELEIEEPTGKPVICINSKQIYRSVVIAAAETGINKSNIYQCCLGYKPLAGGYQWSYYEEGNTYELNKDIELLKKENRVPLGLKDGTSKKVICINTLEIFNSVKEASEKYNITPSCISSVCRGESLTAAGYQWSFYEKDKEYKLKNIKPNSKDRNNKKVICIETKEIFDSAKEAALKYNILTSSISSCCTGRNLTAGKLQWSFYEPGKEYKLKTIPDKFESIKRKVICIETGEIFNSVKDASVAYKTIDSNIRAVYAGKQVTAGGYQWAYYEQGKEYTLKTVPIKGEKSKKKVICIETNIIYGSLKEAKESTGITSIGDCLRGRIKKAGGYTWEFYTE